jgi:hypothetical protein
VILRHCLDCRFTWDGERPIADKSEWGVDALGGGVERSAASEFEGFWDRQLRRIQESAESRSGTPPADRAKDDQPAKD